jgi:hypothetical protein
MHPRSVLLGGSGRSAARLYAMLPVLLSCFICAGSCRSTCLPQRLHEAFLV